MGYNFGSYIIEEVSSGCESKIKHEIEKLNQECFMIGSTEDYETDGLLIKVESVFDDWVIYCCIFNQCRSAKPQIIVHSKASYAWIVFDRTLALIAFDGPKCLKQISLPWYYYNAFCVNNRLVVIHELGVCCFDLNANMIWEIVGNDILNDYKVVGDGIICMFEGGQRMKHDL